MTSENNTTYVYVGAEAAGLYRLSPGAEEFEELTNGLPASPVVPVVALHPNNPSVVYAGTQDGPYRSPDRGEHWERLDYPKDAPGVWSFLFRPDNPNIMYLGTAPGEIYRSSNGGNSWQKLRATMGSHECRMSFPTRVIALAADPSAPDELYAGLEVAGVIRSLDGGDTWEEITGVLANSEDTLDLHGVQCSSASPHTVYITTRQGPFIGAHRGEEWLPVDFSQFSPITYTRDLRLAPQDPSTLYVTIGAAARSQQGGLFRSRNLFGAFEKVDRGITVHSTMMASAVDPQAPGHIFCIARDGQVFGSLDDGSTWTEYSLPEKARELRGLAAG